MFPSKSNRQINIGTIEGDYIYEADAHESDAMQRIAELRDRYDLHMKVERFVRCESDAGVDQKYIKE